MASSHSASSPTHARQRSVAPSTTPLPSTPVKEKTPVSSRRSPPKEQTTASPTPKNPASSSSSAWPIPIRRLASSKSKTDSGASATKSSAGPSFLGLREPDAHLEDSAWAAYNASFSRRPGWGTPAWSTPSSSDSDSSSPSKSSFSLSFGLATLLPSSLPLDHAGVGSSNQNTIAQPSNTGLIAVDGKSFIAVYSFLSLLTSPFF